MRNVHRLLPRLLLFTLSIALLFSSEARAAALYYLYDSSGNRIATIDPATVQTTIGTEKIADRAVTTAKIGDGALTPKLFPNYSAGTRLDNGGVVTGEVRY